ncbi:MAG: hydrogenase expression/formation protein HypE, partial [bacterium]
AGGRKTRELIQEVFLKAYGNPIIERLEDSAEIDFKRNRLAFSTDAFVISPPFFEGGDIGKLAVCGVANDLACKGAKLKYLALSFIIEEGFEIDAVKKIALSVRKAAEELGAMVVCGDTKVIEKGKGDGIFVSASGVGEIIYDGEIGADMLYPGAIVIITGQIAQHEASIISARENFSPPIKSDLDFIWDIVESILPYKPLMLRDPTRGGLATVLNEIAIAAGLSITIDENEIPIAEDVRAVADMLGLDPLYMASEGQCVIFAHEKYAQQIVETIKKTKTKAYPSIIGKVTYGKGVYLQTKWGGSRPLIMLEGEQLSRIC